MQSEQLLSQNKDDEPAHSGHSWDTARWLSYRGGWVLIQCNFYSRSLWDAEVTCLYRFAICLLYHVSLYCLWLVSGRARVAHTNKEMSLPSCSSCRIHQGLVVYTLHGTALWSGVDMNQELVYGVYSGT